MYTTFYKIGLFLFFIGYGISLLDSFRSISLLLEAQLTDGTLIGGIVLIQMLVALLFYGLMKKHPKAHRLAIGLGVLTFASFLASPEIYEALFSLAAVFLFLGRNDKVAFTKKAI